MKIVQQLIDKKYVYDKKIYIIPLYVCVLCNWFIDSSIHERNHFPSFKSVKEEEEAKITQHLNMEQLENLLFFHMETVWLKTEKRKSFVSFSKALFIWIELRETKNFIVICCLVIDEKMSFCDFIQMYFFDRAQSLIVLSNYL